MFTNHKACNVCTSSEKIKINEPELFEQFIETHPIIHEGSEGSKEMTGLGNHFMNYFEKRMLRYTHCIGKGESKAYNEVVKNGPYPSTVLEKLEQCGLHRKSCGWSTMKFEKHKKITFSSWKNTLREGSPHRQSN